MQRRRRRGHKGAGRQTKVLPAQMAAGARVSTHMQRRVSHHRNCRGLRLFSRRRQELHGFTHQIHTPGTCTREAGGREGERQRARA